MNSAFENVGKTVVDRGVLWIVRVRGHRGHLFVRIAVRAVFDGYGWGLGGAGRRWEVLFLVLGGDWERLGWWYLLCSAIYSKVEGPDNLLFLLGYLGECKRESHGVATFILTGTPC